MREKLLTVCRRSFLISAAAGIFGIRAIARADDLISDADANDAAGDVFPLPNCPVCDVPLGGEDPLLREENREIRVCDQECLEELRSDYYGFLELIDEQIVEEQRDDYPLDTCVINGTSFDGKVPVDVVFRNRLFRVCCDDCRYEIEQAPAKYFAKLNAAVVKRQRADYPIKTCLVSNKPLGKDAVDHVCANLLVRLADKSQVARFNESPGKYLDDLRELRKKRNVK